MHKHHIDILYCDIRDKEVSTALFDRKHGADEREMYNVISDMHISMDIMTDEFIS